MTFYEVLEQVLDLLRRHGRLSYRALKRQFALDDAYLDDLKAEIIGVQRLAVEEEGTVLVWTGIVYVSAACSIGAPERLVVLRASRLEKGKACL